METNCFGKPIRKYKDDKPKKIYPLESVMLTLEEKVFEVCRIDITLFINWVEENNKKNPIQISKNKNDYDRKIYPGFYTYQLDKKNYMIIYSTWIDVYNNEKLNTPKLSPKTDIIEYCLYGIIFGPDRYKFVYNFNRRMTFSDAQKRIRNDRTDLYKFATEMYRGKLVNNCLIEYSRYGFPNHTYKIDSNRKRKTLESYEFDKEEIINVINTIINDEELEFYKYIGQINILIARSNCDRRGVVDMIADIAKKCEAFGINRVDETNLKYINKFSINFINNFKFDSLLNNVFNSESRIMFYLTDEINDEVSKNIDRFTYVIDLNILDKSGGERMCDYFEIPRKVLEIVNFPIETDTLQKYLMNIKSKQYDRIYKRETII